MRLIIIFIILLLSNNAFAKDVVVDDEKLQIKNVAINLELGAGALFSKGSQSTVMLLNAEIGYMINEFFRIGLDYSSKLRPLENFDSIFQTIGFQLRYNIYKGLFVAGSFGVAIGFVKKAEFQQKNTGIGWGFKVGYSYMPHPNIGLAVSLMLNQRWIELLYTDAGLLVGPEIRF